MSVSRLIAEPPLVVLPSLASAIGLNEAICLQQVHFRGLRSDDGWVAKSIRVWSEDDFPFWGEATVKRTFLSLRKKGLLLDRKAGTGTDQTLGYRVDYDAVEALFPSDQSDPMDRINVHPSTSADRPDAVGQDDPLCREGGEGKSESEKQEGLSALDQDFDDWLNDHEAVTGQPQPRVGTKARLAIRDSYRARRAERYTAGELKLATAGAWSDKFRRENGHTTPTSVLRPTKVHELVGKGMAAVPGAAKKPHPWIDAHMPDLAGPQRAAVVSWLAMFERQGEEVTVEEIQRMLDNAYGDGSGSER